MARPALTSHVLAIDWEAGTVRIADFFLHPLRGFNKRGVVTDVDERRKRVRVDLNGVSLWAAMKDVRQSGQSAQAELDLHLVDHSRQDPLLCQQGPVIHFVVAAQIEDEALRIGVEGDHRCQQERLSLIEIDGDQGAFLV